ncbi:MAG: hypothetical protein IJC56_06490, partial [Clostridia bacterium]|nr:hypothetical protein [Clostridia bacterium]
TSADELCGLVNEVGMLPLFRSVVPGFSVEELTPDEYWFKEDTVGPWQWRQVLAGGREVAYAKLFNGKYGFVSMEVYPHLANFRRDGYDFDARVDDGLVRDSERRLYELISSGLHLSSALRKSFSGKGFESALAALQMRTYVTCSGFEQRLTRNGKPYGWEVSRYEISESVFGGACSAAYDYDPAESREFLIKRLMHYMDRSSAEKLLAI